MWSNVGQQSAKVADPVRLFSLLSLGEIGRHTYVSLKGFILFIYYFHFRRITWFYFTCYQTILLLTNSFIWPWFTFGFSDLSSHKDLAVAILECFSSPSEEIKSAASFALGLHPIFSVALKMKQWKLDPVFFFFRAVARSCSLTLTRSLSRSRAHSRTRTHTHWFSQSLANLLAHFPSIYQSGKKRISNANPSVPHPLSSRHFTR